MAVLLRFLFWPILLGTIAVASYVFHLDIWGHIGTWLIKNPWENILLLLLAYWLCKKAIESFRFSYAVHQGSKLISMKVILPRSDSKIDQEKRTEKDFKEKIAAMEQLFRALNEVKELSFWQTLHFWIFRFMTVSFELFVENGLITFYVLCPKYISSIVEKQITSFYPNAEVLLQKTPDICPAGYKMACYNMITQKPYWYPIRFYEQMQDDPFNDIANVLSKLEPGETASVQLIVTPVFSDSWATRT